MGATWPKKTLHHDSLQHDVLQHDSQQQKHTVTAAVVCMCSPQL